MGSLHEAYAAGSGRLRLKSSGEIAGLITRWQSTPAVLVDNKLIIYRQRDFRKPTLLFSFEAELFHRGPIINGENRICLIVVIVIVMVCLLPVPRFPR